MVTRCVCFNLKFSQLKKIAKKKNATTLEQLQQHVRFGENCQRCHPYVRKMLATGKTVFEVIPINEAKEGQDNEADIS